MSKPDYSQIAEDHASLLVLVRPIGLTIKSKIFNKLFDRVSQLNYFNVAKPLRDIHFKYKRSYTKEDSLWGNFQAHRKVLGLITIGKCTENDNEVDSIDAETSPRKSKNPETKADLIALHRQTAELFEDTLLDSILIILDGNYVSTPEATESHCNSPTEESSPLEKANGETNVKLNIDGSCFYASDDQEIQNGPKTAKMTNGEMPTSHVWFFKDESDCDNLEHKMQDFFNSLFWVLESKRMDRSHERNENLVLLMAPPEKDMGVSLDVESRAYKKKCLGRCRKHLGDLSLLAGMPGEASLHYQTCMETLKTTNDWLWIAGAQEGLAVVSYLILKPKSARPSDSPFGRNVSFSSKRLQGRSNSLVATLQAAANFTLQSGLDLANNKPAIPVVTDILHEDILTNYKDAIINYSKIKESSIIEMEASLKACRILAMYRRVIDASDFLQNVVKINVQLTDEEKVEQFRTLAALYGHLGLNRKSAFYCRIAAMVCVAPPNKKESWPRCYDLLLQALPGFKLSLDYRDMVESESDPIGWPSVKLRVMHELIYSRRRLGDPATSVRHLCLLLNTMFDHISPSECIDLCFILQSYSAKHRLPPNSMALDDGTILPPVPLFKIPVFKNLEIVELSLGTRPVAFKKNKSLGDCHAERAKLSHPFIYSPFINSHIDDAANDKPKVINWVQGDTSQLSFNFRNSLNVELPITNLDVIVEGSEVKGQPVSFVVAPLCEDFEVAVPLTPCSAGDLNIIGYSWEAFGVKSILKFKDLQQILRRQGRLSSTETPNKNIVEEKYSVAVVPPLPLMQTTLTSSLITSVQSTSGLSIGSLVMYAGQRHNFKVVLSSTETTPIERIDLIKSAQGIDDDILQRLIKCSNEEDLKETVPLGAGEKAEVEFEVLGLTDFICRQGLPDRGVVQRPRVGYALQDFMPEKERLLKNLQKHINPGGTMTADIKLCFQYGGGPGKEFCRQSLINIPLFILPSITVQQWKVLPGCSSEVFTLALQLKNPSELLVQIIRRNDASEILCLEPGQVVWLQCVLPRMQNDFSKTGVDPSSEEFDLLDLKSEDYREDLVGHLRDNLDLGWSMPATNADGELSIDDIPFSREDCAVLQESLISWDVSFNGKQQNEASTFELDHLQVMEAKVILSNTSGFDLYDLVMSVSLDGMNDSGEEEEEHIILIGSVLTYQQLLKANDTASSTFSMLTTTSTDGHVVVKCSAAKKNDDDRQSPCSGHSTIVQLPVLSTSKSSVTLAKSSSAERVQRIARTRIDCGSLERNPPSSEDGRAERTSKADKVPRSFSSSATFERATQSVKAVVDLAASSDSIGKEVSQNIESAGRTSPASSKTCSPTGAFFSWSFRVRVRSRPPGVDDMFDECDTFIRL